MPLEVEASRPTLEAMKEALGDEYDMDTLDMRPQESHTHILASASVDNTICLWLLSDTLTLQRTLTEKYSEISAMALPQHDGWQGVLVTGYENGSLKVWNLLGTERTSRISAHQNTVSCLTTASHMYVKGTIL